MQLHRLHLLKPVFRVTEKEKSVRVVVDETVVLVDDKPFFCRSIQHNGESFDFLKSIGFNTIQLTAPATDKQLRDAQRLGVWIVCPPPASAPIRNISTKYDSVLAWSLGEDLVGRDLQIVRQSANDIRESDGRGRRPVVANVNSHWKSMIPLVDIVSCGIEPIGSSFPANRYSDWLDDACQNQLKPMWADIQTELPVAVSQQVELVGGKVPALPVQREQLKFLLYEAITGGARGVRFLSRSRLDADDPETRLRMLSLNWLLQHLDQIGPFVAAGLIQRANDVNNRSDLEVHTVKSIGSILTMVQRTTGVEQWACGDLPPKTLNIPVQTGQAHRQYLLDERGATLLSSARSGISPELQIPSCPYTACVLSTQDPAIVQSVNPLGVNNDAAIELRINLTEQWLAYVHLCENQIATTGQGYPFVGAARQQAERQLHNAKQMMAAGNVPVAIDYLNRADSQIASVGRQLLDSQYGMANGVVSTPFLKHYGLLPVHLKMFSRLAGGTWGPNSLTAGGFENLEQMTKAGWKNHRDESDQLTTKVELSQQAAFNGTYGLKLTTFANNNLPVQIQTKPIWISSAPVSIKAGQLVRIHGFAKLPRMAESFEGLLITDSIGRDSLVTRIQPKQDWQEFTIYRAAKRNGELSVTFAVTGIGEAMVDEVTIRTIDLPESRSQANSEDAKIK